ncbi:Protocadherin Fat 4 [Cichlidogyrus casuarinus]|uniref:Protocadherin Fat 4 n=1 Tax=Cichlidogyrus casuarinus TaxID=1844966 RepID=A0ABD2PSU7_9PLAT
MARVYIKKSLDLEDTRWNSILGQATKTDPMGMRVRIFGFKVRAQDMGFPEQLRSEAYVEVTVEDVNDYVPKVEVMYFGSEGRIGQLTENSAPVPLALISVTDLDSGSWGRVACRSSHNGFELRPINSSIAHVTSFKLVSQTGFYESRKTSNLGTAQIKVKILDVNDCPPVLLNGPVLNLFVDENEPGNFKTRRAIHHFSASDQDFNSTLTYHLTSNPYNALEIDSKTGTLYISTPLDREAIIRRQLISSNPQLLSADERVMNESIASYQDHVKVEFTVVVSDGLHNASAQVLVTVNDRNDNPPVFERSSYELEIEENSAPGKLLLIKALDIDSSSYSKLSYQIRDVNDQFSLQGDAFDASRYFRIDRNTGLLTLQSKLDREVMPHLLFEVTVTDAALGPVKYKDSVHTATAQVSVTVLDENDVAPSFSEIMGTKQFRIAWDTLAGASIFNVTATDPDKAENGTITYHLELISPLFKTSNQSDSAEPSTNFNELFNINKETGNVYLAENLPKNIHQYIIKVTARDQGLVKQRETSSNFIVSVMVSYYPKKRPIQWVFTGSQKLEINRKYSKIS